MRCKHYMQTWMAKHPGKGYPEDRNYIPPQEISITCDGTWHSFRLEPFNQSKKKDKITGIEEINKLDVYEYLQKCPEASGKWIEDQIEKFIFEPVSFTDINLSLTIASESKKVQSFLKSRDKVLYIFGDSYTGKTMHAKALFTSFSREEKLKCYFVESKRLQEIFQGVARKELVDEEELKEIHLNSVVVLDDLNKEKQVNNSDLFETSFLYFLNKFRGRLIITSNFAPKNLPYGDPIKNRIQEDALIVAFTGKPYKKKRGEL